MKIALFLVLSCILACAQAATLSEKPALSSAPLSSSEKPPKGSDTNPLSQKPALSSAPSSSSEKNGTIIDLTGVWSGEGFGLTISQYSLTVGAIGAWSGSIEMQGAGVDTLVGRIESSNGTCDTNSTGAGYRSWWTKDEFRLTAPTKPSTNSTPGADANSIIILRSPVYCEVGSVTGQEWIYDSSTGNATCPFGTSGQRGFQAVPMKNLQVSRSCVKSLPPPIASIGKNGDEATSNRPDFPTFANPGAPASSAGYFVADRPGDVGAGLLTSQGFSWLSYVNNTISPLQGFFRTHECIGQWAYRGVTDKRIITEPEGTVSWTTTCEAAWYDPETKQMRGFGSSTECPTLNTTDYASTKPKDGWFTFSSTLYKNLSYHPNAAPCGSNIAKAPAPSPSVPSGGSMVQGGVLAIFIGAFVLFV